jgi:Zn-dependent membrane protease YugP
MALFLFAAGLLAGSALLVVVPNVPIANFVLWVLVILSVGYLASGWIIQRLYGRALVSMLEQQDFSFMLSLASEEPVGRAVLTRVFDEELARLLAERDRLKDIGDEDSFREARRRSEEMIHNGWYNPV